MLILEDDARPEDPRQLPLVLAQLASQRAASLPDVLVLGYNPPVLWFHIRFNREGPGCQSRTMMPMKHQEWWGSHCYLVSRRGAERLVRLAVPMLLHIDLTLALLAVQGDLVGSMWHQSLVFQQGCLRDNLLGHSSIPKHAFLATNFKLILPDARLGTRLALARGSGRAAG